MTVQWHNATDLVDEPPNGQLLWLYLNHGSAMSEVVMGYYRDDGDDETSWLSALVPEPALYFTEVAAWAPVQYPPEPTPAWVAGE